MTVKRILNEKALIQFGLSLFAALLINCLTISIALAQASVEKAETSQQAKSKEADQDRAKIIVANPNEKVTPPETGRIWGAYSVESSLEVGYRFLDTNGNSQKYLSDVNVRDGLRVLEYSFDARALAGRGVLFDSMRVDVNNAGGDSAQTYSMRMEKDRIYRFSGNVRRFNYFRFLPIWSENLHNQDYRQQVSDFNLKLFPQRRVKINMYYGRSMSTGAAFTTYSAERDQFPVNVKNRWEANEFRLGLDANYHGWTFFGEQMYRNYKDDSEQFSSGTNPGYNTTNTSALSFFDRDYPSRGRVLMTRGSVSGNIASKLHVLLRGMYSDERMRAPMFEFYTGTDNSNNKILAKSLNTTGLAKRPSTSIDGVIAYDIAENVTVSNTIRYTSFRILGDVNNRTISTLQPPTGPARPPATTTSFDARGIYLDSFWNTLMLQFNMGKKFSGNIGWRSTYREVKVTRPTATETETQNNNNIVSGIRFQPTKRVNLFFDYEKGTWDNAFLQISPLNMQRVRVRANFNVTDTLSLNATLSSTDRTNPTPFVSNTSDFRAFAVSGFWEPSTRFWLTGGYNYDDLFATANIAFSTGAAALTRGTSQFYSRQHFMFLDTRVGITKRLDLLMVYRYLTDIGAPNTARTSAGPYDFIASFPLYRHNPEARLAYRFNNHVTGNLSYRHFSYNEKNFRSDLVGFRSQDYAANIMTTSLRFTF